jgi:hypothetical protein
MIHEEWHMPVAHPDVSRTEKVGRPSDRRTSQGRHMVIALALASLLPCAALLRPEAFPREVVVLALIAWLGIFVVAVVSTRR